MSAHPDGVIEQLVSANHILSALGVCDGFGHVSARNPSNPEHFFMARSMAPALVQGADIITHNLTGESVSASGAQLYLERFIHSAIYRNRTDVGAIVHSHLIDVIPFTVVPSVRLRPICHMCGFLSDLGIPFDVSDNQNSTGDLLIRNSPLGHAFATHLGLASVALMRGHGFTAVGASLSAAVFRAFYTGVNCRIQMAATTLGAPHFLSAEEAAACDQATTGQIERVWALWRQQVGG